jgi:hypothetical protein
MAALWLGGIRAVAQFGKLLVEQLDRSLTLFEQIVDERLLTIDQCLLVGRDFLDVVLFSAFFRHGGFAGRL